MKHILIALMLLFTSTIFAQVGVGTTTPASSAMLEVSSTTKGFLPPRLTSTERDAITNPAEGLIIYNKTVGKIQVCVKNSSTVSQLSSSLGVNCAPWGYNLGQTFTVSSSCSLASIAVGFENYQHVSFNITVSVYRGSPSFPLPSSIASATSLMPSTSNSGMVNFNFSSSLNLSPGRYYFIASPTTNSNTNINYGAYTDTDSTGNQVSEEMFLAQNITSSIL